ncbi:porin [Aquabacterium sp.]|uniref:porin n=1 Tax=Aquabacterium sp. TaxID=1872578 RepID=UPI002489D2DA|nr:porin [Aquabacterium sp.]MDI1258481.1 porin [Aquabacterium sp.]
MQKNVLTKAVAVALATLGAGSAMAQSSVTLYGHADISVDHVSKTAGVRLIPLDPATQGVKSSVTRVSPSGTSQTSFGFKGTEVLGDGYSAGFVLEGQLGHDTGALGQDGRIFGRQSYVGLTTPFGEVRLGRQYAPIFYSTAFVTGERFGATDLFTEGGATNNLQVRQDNQISYWLKAGGFTGSVAYSPNAGSLSTISAARGGQVNGNVGGILGNASSGTESTTNKTGRAAGAFGNMAFNEAFNMTLGYHQNEFDGARFGVYNAASPNALIATSAFILDKYQAANIGAKYVMPGSGIMFDAALGQGVYGFDNSDDLKLQFMVIGTRVPVGQWTLSAQVSQIKFKNFTKGKDTGVMLGAEYALSKRTSLYTRAVQVRDDEGTAASMGIAAPVVGGPDVIATAVGFRETPLFAGANINPGGKSTYFGVGIRHSF